MHSPRKTPPKIFPETEKLISDSQKNKTLTQLIKWNVYSQRGDAVASLQCLCHEVVLITYSVKSRA